MLAKISNEYRKIAPGKIILRSEIIYALETMKTGKAAGTARIPIELIKLFDDDVIDTFLDLLNRI